MSIQISISMKLFVCPHCGCTYGVPESLQSYECPSCASRRRLEVMQDRDEAQMRVNSLERQVSHMRGALTRAKRRGS